MNKMKTSYGFYSITLDKIYSMLLDTLKRYFENVCLDSKTVPTKDHTTQTAVNQLLATVNNHYKGKQNSLTWSKFVCSQKSTLKLHIHSATMQFNAFRFCKKKTGLKIHGNIKLAKPSYTNTIDSILIHVWKYYHSQIWQLDHLSNNMTIDNVPSLTKSYN